MQLHQVSSDFIRCIGCDCDIIEVHFTNGSVWQYRGSQELFAAFLNAPSKGAFFSRFIRNLPHRMIRR